VAYRPYPEYFDFQDSDLNFRYPYNYTVLSQRFKTAVDEALFPYIVANLRAEGVRHTQPRLAEIFRILLNILNTPFTVFLALSAFLSSENHELLCLHEHVYFALRKAFQGYQDYYTGNHEMDKLITGMRACGMNSSSILPAGPSMLRTPQERWVSYFDRHLKRILEMRYHVLLHQAARQTSIPVNYTFVEVEKCIYEKEGLLSKIRTVLEGSIRQENRVYEGEHALDRVTQSIRQKNTQFAQDPKRDLTSEKPQIVQTSNIENIICIYHLLDKDLAHLFNMSSVLWLHNIAGELYKYSPDQLQAELAKYKT